MSLKLLSIDGFLQSKLVVAHADKVYLDAEGNYVIRIDKKLSLLVEKGIRKNNTEDILIRYLDGGVTFSVNVTLVKYSWSYRGIKLTFSKSKVTEDRVSTLSKILAFIGF